MNINEQWHKNCNSGKFNLIAMHFKSHDLAKKKLNIEVETHTRSKGKKRRSKLSEYNDGI